MNWKNIENLTEHYYQVMLNHPYYSLVPAQRQEIYLSFGPLNDPRAHKVRGWLSILTTKQVLPLWKDVYPGDNTPQTLLDLGEGVLLNRVAPQRASEEASRILQAVENSEGEAGALEYHKELHVLQAAVSAVFDVVRDGPFWGTLLIGSKQHPIESYTDADLDYWSSDTVLWSLTVYAGGLWNPTYPPAKRWEWWRWWLKAAIPKAWELAHEY